MKLRSTNLYNLRNCY